MSSRRSKAASVPLGLRTGSGRLFRADGPTMAKARRLYVLIRWRGTCSRFLSTELRRLWLKPVLRSCEIFSEISAETVGVYLIGQSLVQCSANSSDVLAGCVAQCVISTEFKRCYDDASICFWTDESVLTQFEAQAACRQRDLFLPRVTDSVVRSKLAEFRANASHSVALASYGFWIDVTAVSSNTFQWIDGSPLAGLSCGDARWNVSLGNI